MRRVAGLALAGLALTFGMNVQAAAPLPDNFTLDTAIDAMLAKPLVPVVHKWSGGAVPVLTETRLTHECLLTGIGGNFAGGGEHVTLGTDLKPGGGQRWIFSAASSQPGLHATVTCFPKSAFSSSIANGPSAFNDASMPAWVAESCRETDYLFAKEPEQAGFIREVFGKLRGAGESIGVVKVGSQQFLRLQGCSGYFGGAVSMLATWKSGPIKYLGPNGKTNDPALATFVISPAFPANGAKVMAPVNKAICGLVGISGKFDGPPSYAEIVAQGGNWVLRTDGSTKPDAVAAAARCVARDQR